MRNLATGTESVLLIEWKKCLNGCTTAKKLSKMRFALRNKTKLINAFGEAYYNELIASINSFQSNYTPDCHYWNEAIQKEMLDMPSSTHLDKTFSFAIVSEMWDVITLAYYSESNTPSK